MDIDQDACLMSVLFFVYEKLSVEPLAPSLIIYARAGVLQM